MHTCHITDSVVYSCLAEYISDSSIKEYRKLLKMAIWDRITIALISSIDLMS